MAKQKISISWSGGKDSALALHQIIHDGRWEVDHLHTVFIASNRRVGLHGIPEELIQKQADIMSIPLRKLYLDESKTTNAYHKLMTDFYTAIASEGIRHVMFGDIFLEDLKDFRDSMLREVGLTGVYPLWMKDSMDLLEQFHTLGFSSIICAADASKLDKSWLGSPLTKAVMKEDIDPCGENGEYHSYVTSGPLFKRDVNVQIGAVRSKKYSYEVLTEAGDLKEMESEFWFVDMS